MMATSPTFLLPAGTDMTAQPGDSMRQCAAQRALQFVRVNMHVRTASIHWADPPTCLGRGKGAHQVLAGTCKSSAHNATENVNVCRCPNALQRTSFALTFTSTSTSTNCCHTTVGLGA